MFHAALQNVVNCRIASGRYVTRTGPAPPGLARTKSITHRFKWSVIAKWK